MSLENWFDDLQASPSEPEVSEEATIKFFQEERKLRDALHQNAKDGFDEDPLEELSTAEIKILGDKALAEKAKEELGKTQFNAARVFRAEEPGYISTPSNDQRMGNWMESHDLDATNPDHFHAAFEALKEAKLISHLTPPPKPRPNRDPESMTYEELENAARGSW